MNTKALPAPQTASPAARPEGQPRNELARPVGEPGNPVASPGAAENGRFKLETSEACNAVAGLEPGKQAARLHINDEEEEDVNNSKKI